MKINVYENQIGNMFKNDESVKSQNSIMGNIFGNNEAGKEELSIVEKSLNLYNLDLSPDEVVQIEKFVANTDGDLSEKIQAVEAAGAKGIELSESNLKDVYTALKEDFKLDDTALKYAAESTSSQSSLIEGLNSENAEVRKESLIQIIELLNLPSEFKESLISEIESSLDLTVSLENINQIIGDIGKLGNSEIVDFLIEITDKLMQVEIESLNIELALVEDESPEEIANNSVKSDIDEENEINSENEEINDKLSLLNDAIGGIIEEMDLENSYESIIPSLNIKTYLITEITVKMTEVKNEFEVMQKEVEEKLSVIIEKLENPSTSEEAKSIVKESLTRVIDKLDNKILNSDITLYTDMKTEKDLLLSSSKLGSARAFIEDGDLKSAANIVKEVSKQIVDIKFNPSNKKVQGIAQENIKDVYKMLAPQKVNKELAENEILDKVVMDQGQSSKAVYDVLKNLGLNYESELAQQFDKNPDAKFEEMGLGNIKAILMKLSADENELNIVEKTESSLMNLSGQQMMSDQGKQNKQGSKLFNIPYKENEKIKNMKVFLSSNSTSSKMDWENCSVYFAINPEGSSDAGIKIKVNQRKLDIELYSDDEQFKEKFEGKLDSVLDTFNEIGFESGSVKYKNFEEKTVAEKFDVESIESKEVNSEINENKRFDLKL